MNTIPTKPLVWHQMKDEKPIPHWIVLCRRKFTNHRGREVDQFRIAQRNSGQPPTFHEDLSRDAWWQGANESQGSSWSDSTVLEWAYIESQLEDIKP